MGFQVSPRVPWLREEPRTPTAVHRVELGGPGSGLSSAIMPSATSTLTVAGINLLCRGDAFAPPGHGRGLFIPFLLLEIQTFQRKSLGASKCISEEGR